MTSPSQAQLDSIDQLIDSVISSDVVVPSNSPSQDISTPSSPITLSAAFPSSAPLQAAAPITPLQTLQPITLAQLASALPHTVHSLAAHQQQQQQEQAAVQHVLLNTVHQQQQLLKQQQEAAQALTAALAAGGTGVCVCGVGGSASSVADAPSCQHHPHQVSPLLLQEHSTPFMATTTTIPPVVAATPHTPTLSAAINIPPTPLQPIQPVAPVAPTPVAVLGGAVNTAVNTSAAAAVMGGGGHDVLPSLLSQRLSSAATTGTHVLLVGVYCMCV